MRADLQKPALIEAIQRAAQRKGIKDVAGELDLAPSSLYAMLNPYGDRTVCKLGIENALAIMQYTGDKSPLAIMAGELGCSIVERREPDKPTTAEEGLQDVSAVSRFEQAVQEHASLAEVNRLAMEAYSEIGQTVALYAQQQQVRQ